MPYVITSPPGIRGVHETWETCKAVVASIPGARYQKVNNLDEAQMLLDGHGVVLSPGLYAFTDGNALGGVGVVLVEMGLDPAAQPSVLQEISTSVGAVFAGGGIHGLESAEAVEEALASLNNILSEMAGLYHALGIAPQGARVTVVHDYMGVANWMEGHWKMKHPIVTSVVLACKQLAKERGFQLKFRHQRGHTSSWAGRHDFARLNALADKLATAGGRDI